MAYTLHPATVADAEDITRIFNAAFAEDHIMAHFHPHTPAHLKWEQDLEFFRMQLKECGRFGGRFTKVVEGSTGEIVAFSKWDYPIQWTDELRQEKERRMGDKSAPLEGSNQALMDEFFKELRRGREKWIVEGETFFLHILAIHPSHQCRGLGHLLIAPGLEAADAAGKKTYIEASPKGLELYKKHGWVEVDAMVLEMEKFGLQGVERQPFLIREPGAGIAVKQR